MGVVSIRHFPSIGKFAVPQSSPSGFKDVKFGFVLNFSGCPEFVAGVWELVWCVFSPGCGIDALEWVLAKVAAGGQVGANPLGEVRG